MSIKEYKSELLKNQGQTLSICMGFAKDCYEAGADSRPEEVLKLQNEVDDLQKRIKELELINFDSELHFDAAKEQISELQSRINKTDSLIMSFGDDIDAPLRNALIDAVRGLEDI